MTVRAIVTRMAPLMLTVLCAGPVLSLSARTVRVGVYDNNPKIGLSAAGEVQGIFADLIEDIAAAEGWRIEYVHGTWAEGLDRLNRGEIDLMPDVASTPSRLRQFTLHQEPVLSDWFQIYTRRMSGVRSLVDLHGKRVSVLERSIQQEAFEKIIAGFDLQITLLPFPDYRAAFSAVADGRSDAVIVNRFYGTAHLREHPLEDTAIIFSPTRLFFAARNPGADVTLLDALDRHLARLKKDPESVYYRSLRRWTSERTAFALPVWLKTVIALVCVLLLSSLFWSIELKRQVRLQTRDLARRNRELQDLNEQKEQTERKLAQYHRELEAMVASRTAEVEAANEQLTAIFQTANVGIAVLRNRAVVRCNPRLEEMFGYAPGEMEGSPTHPWYTNETDYETVGRDVRNAIWSGKVYRGLVRYRRKDGSLFWASLTDRALDVRDTEKGLVTVIEDVTAEREAAESLRRALEQAEAADRLKSAFLATMSHELRTPLNSIIGFSGILLQERVGPLNPEQRKQLDMVRGSSRHLLALINDILDISKIEAGQLDLRIEPFDVCASAAQTARLIQPLAEKKGLALRTDLPEQPVLLNSDQRRFEQILLNLLNNAVKFTERGSVTLSVRPCGDTLRIAVADTGIGIRPADLDSLFKPFRQIDTGLSRQYEGTGLGLAICRRLAEKMGGTMSVTSEWGQGSVFTCTLPYP